MDKYLYNDIQLPALPEWDKIAYPYAVMGYYSDTRVRVVMCKYPYHMIWQGTKEVAEPNDISGTGIAYYYNLGDTDWTYNGVTVLPADAQVSRVFWTNHDLYYADDYSIDESLAGTLYLAASDPIPVASVVFPLSPYIRKNGAWQKQDIYKRIGGQWVKQPQDGYKSQNEAWNPLFNKGD